MKVLMTTLHHRHAEGQTLYALKEPPPDGPLTPFEKVLLGRPTNRETTEGLIDALIAGGCSDTTAVILVDMAIRYGKGVAA